MKKVLSVLSLAVLATGLVGCGSTGSRIGPPMVRVGVSTVTGYALAKHPQAMPVVRASADVICAQAASTNLSPVNVVAAVHAYTEQTPESVLIVNGALSLYTLVWNSYGTDAVNNLPTLQQYLQATCDGLNEALTAYPKSALISRNTLPNSTWPLVRTK